MIAWMALLLAQGAFPPRLPAEAEIVTDSSEEFLKPGPSLRAEVSIAKTPPSVDFLYYPGQEYPGKPWSTWGDSLCARGRYYSSIGDHLAPGGNAFVYEYDPATRKLRRIVDLRQVLGLAEGHYTPGKIHGRLDLGADGALYFSTHRGSTKVTTDQYHYKGDWILRHSLETGKTEVVAQGPVPKHCIPASVLDPDRLIFYGGTAAGSDAEGGTIHFFAWDVKSGKALWSGPDGPARYLLFARSTGRVYYTSGKEDMVGPLMRFDPAAGGAPVKIEASLGLRAATVETPQGVVYTVSKGGKGNPSTLFAFDVKTEKAESLGDAAVGSQNYIASIDADPSGRFLYYIPAAHGGAEQDGTPVVQFDVKSRKKKVIAFLHPFYNRKYGLTPVGTFSTAVDETGGTLYVTWNVNRGGRAWDCTGMMAIRIPESER